MLFSRTAEYALRAMTFLATQPAGKLAGAREIAQAERIPMPFLWKILQNLARQRLIRSFKGIHGGYQLARSSDKITIHDVVMATDGEDFSSQCVLGLPSCSEQAPCPLHDSWKRVRAGLLAMLEQNTLADVAEVAKKRAAKKK